MGKKLQFFKKIVIVLKFLLLIYNFISYLIKLLGEKRRHLKEARHPRIEGFFEGFEGDKIEAI